MQHPASITDNEINQKKLSKYMEMDHHAEESEMAASIVVEEMKKKKMIAERSSFNSSLIEATNEQLIGQINDEDYMNEFQKLGLHEQKQKLDDELDELEARLNRKLTKNAQYLNPVQTKKKNLHSQSGLDNQSRM